MTENTKVGRELYYLIEDIIKDSLCRLHESYCTWRNEYPDLGREEFEERFTDHYSELSEELFFKIVEYLHTAQTHWYNQQEGLLDRSVFIREVTSPNEPTKKGGSQ